MTRWMLILSLVVPFYACGGEEESPEPEPIEEVEQETPEEVAEVDPTEDEIPIAEDFEDEAESEITAENYASVLDELEAEVGDE